MVWCDGERKERWREEEILRLSLVHGLKAAWVNRLAGGLNTVGGQIGDMKFSQVDQMPKPSRYHLHPLCGSNTAFTRSALLQRGLERNGTAR